MAGVMERPIGVVAHSLGRPVGRGWLRDGRGVFRNPYAGNIRPCEAEKGGATYAHAGCYSAPACSSRTVPSTSKRCYDTSSRSGSTWRRCPHFEASSPKEGARAPAKGKQ
jgi:hypothetical protein